MKNAAISYIKTTPIIKKFHSLFKSKNLKKVKQDTCHSNVHFQQEHSENYIDLISEKTSKKILAIYHKKFYLN
ncbi:hypothetical protein A0O36_02557 [Piscirickettsiaceae bacterium NZ-RLO1]|nr:hypothetical protein A0O36_02557 [Piscirickettsiaceae bacterium NZ-RLO1]